MTSSPRYEYPAARPRRSGIAPAIALLSLFYASPTLAATCDGVSVPDNAPAGGNLVLNGLGIRKATMFAVHVYIGALYLPEKSSDAQKILAARQPWQVVMQFERDVSASDMRGAFEEGFKKAAGNKLASLQDRITAMNNQMIDVKEGQSISYVNDPAKGVTVTVAGKSGAPIAGEDFATALMTIWIGSEPPNPDLKSGMLGGKCE